MLKLERPWRTQPQGVVGVNKAHPLAAGLRSAGYVAGSVPFDVVNSGAFSASGANLALVPGRFGIAASNLTGGSSGAWTRTGAVSIPVSSAFSAWCIAYSNVAAAGLKRAVRYFGGASTVIALDFGDNSSGSSIGGVCQVVGGTFPSAVSSITNEPGRLYSVLFTRNGAELEIYIDGANRTSTRPNASSANLITPITGTLLANNSSALPLQGGVLAFGAWDRALSPAEAALLTINDAWQLFAPRRIWVPQAGITGLPTLTALSPINVTSTTALQRFSRA